MIQFLFKHDGQVVRNTGQSFRSFWKEGFQGHRATLADWRLHLNTLFPEVRLKNTLEVRCCDALPMDLTCTVPALLTGLVYDERAFGEAEALTERFDYASVEAARPELVRDGLAASLCGRPAVELAERLVDIAAGGLERRARRTPGGNDERVHLRALVELVQAGRSPADVLTDGLDLSALDLAPQILDRTRL